MAGDEVPDQVKSFSSNRRSLVLRSEDITAGGHFLAVGGIPGGFGDVPIMRIESVAHDRQPGSPVICAAEICRMYPFLPKRWGIPFAIKAIRSKRVRSNHYHLSFTI